LQEIFLLSSGSVFSFVAPIPTLRHNIYSHNHPMFDSLNQKFINWLGGIQPDPEAVGFDRASSSEHRSSVSVRPTPYCRRGWCPPDWLHEKASIGETAADPAGN
jgi:hypothetical protein